MSGFSPQQLEDMLDAVAQEATSSISNPFSQSFEQSSYSAQPMAVPLPNETAVPQVSQTALAQREEPREVGESSGVGAPPPITVTGSRTDAKGEVQEAPSDEDFSSFAGDRLAPRSALPKGAKNVKCHSFERGDDGRISRVFTYDMESAE